MIELTPLEFPAVLPLLADVRQQVLPAAICQGINPGRVFVDRQPDPRTVLIWSSVGYYILAGDPARCDDFGDLRAALEEVLIPASQALGETGFILVPSTPAWKAHLPDLLPGREVIEIYRRPFRFDAARFAEHSGWRERIPAGLNLRAVDADLAERLNVRASWASVDDFLTHGLGFVLLDGEQIASACLSVLASRERLEMDVHTEEAYQRRGLASICACALIEACLRRGLTPNWECFWDNDPSSALAERLGFVPLPDYPVFFWE